MERNTVKLIDKAKEEQQYNNIFINMNANPFKNIFFLYNKNLRRVSIKSKKKSKPPPQQKIAIEDRIKVYLAESKMNYLLEYSPKKMKVVFKKQQCTLLGGK